METVFRARKRVLRMEFMQQGAIIKSEVCYEAPQKENSCSYTSTAGTFQRLTSLILFTYLKNCLGTRPFHINELVDRC
jgi:hypothetical protein